jgi:hypothetical protein
MLKYAKYLISPSTVVMEKQRSDFICTRKQSLPTNKKMRKFDLGNVDQALLECFKLQRNAGFPTTAPF